MFAHCAPSAPPRTSASGVAVGVLRSCRFEPLSHEHGTDLVFGLIATVATIAMVIVIAIVASNPVGFQARRAPGGGHRVGPPMVLLTRRGEHSVRRLRQPQAQAVLRVGSARLVDRCVDAGSPDEIFSEGEHPGARSEGRLCPVALPHEARNDDGVLVQRLGLGVIDPYEPPSTADRISISSSALRTRSPPATDTIRASSS